MKRLLIALSLLPVLVLAIFIIQRKNHRSYDKGDTATKRNSKYVRLEKDWLTNAYEPIGGMSRPEIVARLSKLEKRKLGASDIDFLDKANFDEQLANVLMAFKSTNFDAFLSLRTNAATLPFARSFIDGFAEYLEKQGTNRPKTDIAVAAAYWKMMSSDGRDVEKWKGVCWDKSFVKCSSSKDKDVLIQENYNKSLDYAFPNCGISATTSILQYRPEPADVFAANGKLILADAYVLSKFAFNSEELAYPIMLRFYWDQGRQSWLPWIIGIGYGGDRPNDPVF